jgi:hypothetical protein
MTGRLCRLSLSLSLTHTHTHTVWVGGTLRETSCFRACGIIWRRCSVRVPRRSMSFFVFFFENLITNHEPLASSLSTESVVCVCVRARAFVRVCLCVFVCVCVIPRGNRRRVQISKSSYLRRCFAHVFLCDYKLFSQCTAGAWASR